LYHSAPPSRRAHPPPPLTFTLRFFFRLLFSCAIIRRYALIPLGRQVWLAPPPPPPVSAVPPKFFFLTLSPPLPYVRSPSLMHRMLSLSFFPHLAQTCLSWKARLCVRPFVYTLFPLLNSLPFSCPRDFTSCMRPWFPLSPCPGLPKRAVDQNKVYLSIGIFAPLSLPYVPMTPGVPGLLPHLPPPSPFRFSPRSNLD